MAATDSYAVSISVSNSPFSIRSFDIEKLRKHNPMVFSLTHFISSFCFMSFCFISFSLYRKRTVQQREARQTQVTIKPDPPVLDQSPSKIEDETHEECEKNQTHLTRSLLLKTLHPDSPKGASLLGGDGPDSNGYGSADDGNVGSGDSCLDGDEIGKRKKKRVKKKKLNSQGEDGGAGGGGGGKEGRNGSGLDSSSRVKQELVCLYPFTSSASATQRKIKRQYC